jgi:hypothetical protein
MTPGVYRPAGRHPFGHHAAIPFLHTAIQVQPGETYAAAVALSADRLSPGAPPQLTIELRNTDEMTATITWPNGTQDQLTL